MTAPTAVYALQDGVAHASALAGGPWDQAFQHGSAPAALVAHVVEGLPCAGPMHLARLTVDLMRPVPVAPLRVTARVVRDGRAIQVCQVTLSSGDVEVVRASAVRLRIAADPTGLAQARPTHLPDPEGGRDADEIAGMANPFLRTLSVRVVRGAFRSGAPAAVWYRADVPIVVGQPISPAMRAAVAADLTNGTTAVLDFDCWTFVNADLSIHLARPPEGEWVLIDGESWIEPSGLGLAHSRLGDRRGWFGIACQSLLLAPR